VATYFVWTGGSNTSPYDTWAKAATAFGTAVAAATSAGDIIKVSHVNSESISGDANYTFAADVRVISCNKDSSDAPTVGATITGGAGNYTINLAGAFDVYIYGLTFNCGTGGGSRGVQINFNDGGHYETELCTFSPSAGGNVIFNQGSSAANNYSRHIKPTFNFKTSSAGLQCFNRVEIYEATLAGTAPATLIKSSTTHGINATFVNKGQTTVTAFNCSSGDTHYALYHGDAFGETAVSTTIYADDGAQYDGTNRCSWVITTRENNCSFFTPYVSPWIDRYHSGTSAISLSLECLRDGNTTVYDNDEVWGEFSFKATPAARRRLSVTTAWRCSARLPADRQHIAWTGGTTPGKFKLESGSITPAEIGHLRARVVVGEPNITVYVDPQIRIA
jgi:hypothetical protein